MMPIICYLAVLLGSMAVASVVYTSVMLGWCCFGLRLPHPSSAGAPETRSLSLNPYLASTFKYTKDGVAVAILEQESCAVCLSGFKDGDNVCQLPNCNHSFHSPCIDMWLYSHSDCPVCRASVDRRVDSPNRALATEENSREVLLDISF